MIRGHSIAALFISGSILFGFTLVAEAQSANLIANGSFETGTTAPDSWTKDFWGTPTPTFTYPAAGNAGSKGVSVTLSANSTGDANWQPAAPVAVTAGASYTYSLSYNSNVATEIDAEYTSSSGAVSYAWLADVPSSAGVWKQLSITFTVPAGMTKAKVYALIFNKGTLSIDDVSLVSGAGTTPPPPPPPATTTASIAASPTAITAGQSSTLTWSSANATSCTGSNGWTGAKALSGTQVVSPTATATYVLTCTGAGGTATQQAVVTVSPATSTKPTLAFSASPASITSGQSSTLTWSAANATSCTASGGWTGAKTTSGTLTVSPTGTTAYSLTCAGAGGSVASSVSVTVTAVTPPSANAFSEGMVTLSFDDSWLSQYVNALPILNAAGLKGTFYLTTQPLQEGWTDFMTPANVQTIASQGHEIADHTVTHPHLPQLSSAQVQTEIVNSRNYLQSLTGKTITTMAYPYGEFNATTITVVKQAGYTSARGTEDTILTKPSTDKFNLMGDCVLKSTSFATIKAKIDSAKANKQWYIMCIHEVRDIADDYSMTPAQFQQIVNYLKQIGIKVVTIQQGRALMGN